MKKLPIRLVKFLVACSGPGFVFYATELFEEYFATGAVLPDPIHSVLVNNHGVYRYISEAQDRTFHLVLGAGAIGVFGTFAGILIQKFRKK